MPIHVSQPAWARLGHGTVGERAQVFQKVTNVRDSNLPLGFSAFSHLGLPPSLPMGLRRALVLALPLLATSLHVQAHVRPALRAAPAVTLSVPRVAAPCRMATNVTVSSTEPVQRLPPPSLSKIAMRVSVPVTIAMCIFYFFGSSLVRGAMGVYHACELTTSKHDPSFLHSPCD